jgi:mRNA interferase YafQ
MLDVRYSTKFKKDFKTCVKRHYDIGLLQQAIDTLRIPDTLPPKNKDHNLSGNYFGYRECHIETDWLLIYRYADNELLLHRTGTHSDLFDI